MSVCARCVRSEISTTLSAPERSEYLVLQRAIRLMQAQLDWLEECRELIRPEPLRSNAD